VGAEQDPPTLPSACTSIDVIVVVSVAVGPTCLALLFRLEPVNAGMMQIVKQSDCR